MSHRQAATISRCQSLILDIDLGSPLSFQVVTMTQMNSSNFETCKRNCVLALHALLRDVGGYFEPSGVFCLALSMLTLNSTVVQCL